MVDQDQFSKFNLDGFRRYRRSGWSKLNDYLVMYSITKVFMNAWRIVNQCQQRNVWKTCSSTGYVCRMCDHGYRWYMMFVVDGCSMLHLHRSSVIAQLCWPGTTAMGSHRKWFQLHTAAKPTPYLNVLILIDHQIIIQRFPSNVARKTSVRFLLACILSGPHIVHCSSLLEDRPFGVDFFALPWALHRLSQCSF